MYAIALFFFGINILYRQAVSFVDHGMCKTAMPAVFEISGILYMDFLRVIKILMKIFFFICETFY